MKSMAYRTVLAMQKPWSVEPCEVHQRMSEWLLRWLMKWKNPCTAHWINQWIKDSRNQCISWSMSEQINTSTNQSITESMNQWDQQCNETMKQQINESVVQWFSESVNRWTSESTNQWMNDSMSQWIIEPMNQATNESNNQWILPTSSSKSASIPAVLGDFEGQIELSLGFGTHFTDLIIQECSQFLDVSWCGWHDGGNAHFLPLSASRFETPSDQHPATLAGNYLGFSS